MMSLWDALRMNMMISYQELVRTFLCITRFSVRGFRLSLGRNKTSHLSFLSSIV
ncbi:Uncharacterised protein [Klebsiella pneumoniae]|nr:Uncharacterised protein [Klebsiella pneumoniae]